MLRRHALAALLALAAAPLAHAAGVPFEQVDFEAARRGGKPVLIMVHADWCPTCRKQAPAVEDLLKQSEFSGIQLLVVDFDMQEDVRKTFRVTKQSTLILFKGDKEVSRSTGETRPEAIAQMLRKAL